VGHFRANLKLGATTLTAPSTNQEDIFVARLDSGGKWVWAVSHSSGLSEMGRAVALDKAGNVYVAGETAKGSAGKLDAMVGKVSPTGTWAWVRTMGGTSDDCAQGLALDAAGNVRVAGTYHSKGHCGTTALPLWAPNAHSYFLCTLDSKGNHLSALTAGPGRKQYVGGVAAGPAGRPHVAGWFTDSAIFNGVKLTALGASGKTDIFVWRP